MADKTIYYKVETTGGGAGAVDAVNGNVMVSKDVAHVLSSDDNRFLLYTATTQGSSGGTGTSELPPFNITPDNNSSKWSWELQRGLNDTVEKFQTTGGTMTPYGMSVLDIQTSDPNATFFLTPGRVGAKKDIVLYGGTSQTIRVLLSSTGNVIGYGSTIHGFKHDSDPQMASKISTPTMSLRAESSDRWLIIGQETTSLRSFEEVAST